MRHHWKITLIVAGLSTPAAAAEFLTSVESEVHQTTGTPREIAARASKCISQHLSPGTADAQVIVNSDLDGGTIVARNAIEYGSLMRWKIRSSFTLEAREGRFRISQTNLERFHTNSLTGVEAWGPIGKWTGSGWKKAEETFAASATAVAKCIMSAPPHDNW